MSSNQSQHDATVETPRQALYRHIARLATAQAAADFHDRKKTGEYPSHVMFILDAAASNSAHELGISNTAARKSNEYSDLGGTPLSGGKLNEWDEPEMERRREKKEKAEQKKREKLMDELGVTAEEIEEVRRLKVQKEEQARMEEQIRLRQKRDRKRMRKADKLAQAALEGEQAGVPGPVKMEKGGQTVSDARYDGRTLS
jgi:hypothetical protein